MASRRQELKAIAVAMIADGWEPTFYELVARLQREAGASHADANRVVLELLHSGPLKTTWGSRIALREHGHAGGGAGNILGIAASILGIVAAMLGIWEIGARNGFIPGPGPFEIVFPTPGPVPSFDNGPVIPTIPSGEQLDAPELSISGDCSTGYTLRWTAVSGAEDYRIEEDGHFRGQESDTELFIPAAEVFQDHRYAVFAEALLRPGSPSSNLVNAAACS